MMLGKRKAVSMVPPSKKKRKSAPAIEEIKFDMNAREDYLTGFHKRKLHRAKHAREEAAKRDREAKIEARKILRDGRKADLVKHVQEVNAMLKRPNEDAGSQSDSVQGEEEQWDGIAEPPTTNHEVEYVDDERFTTVTVEAVDISREGFHKVAEEADSEDADGEGDGLRTAEDPRSGEREDQEHASSGKRKWTKERPGGPKKRKKKFRYESKVERKMTRHKERSRNSKQAKERKL